MMIKRLLLGMALTFLLVSVGDHLQAPAVLADQAAPEVGQVTPDFTFKDLSGNTVSLSDLRGHPIFFAPWFTGCPVCQGEMKEWQAFHEAFGDLVKVLGIDVADSPQAVQSFIQQRGVTFTILLDPQGSFVLQYKITKMPTLFFVDPQGVIREISKTSLTADGIAAVFADKVFQVPILPLTSFTPIEQASQGAALGELIDTDSDGQPDGARVNLNGDGTLTATVALFKGHLRGSVPSEKALKITQLFQEGVQVVEVDLKGDGKPEITIKSRLSDAQILQITVDLDGDGTPELSWPNS